MLRVAFDERFYEGGFSHTRRTDDSDDGGRWFGREAINEGNMQPLFFDLTVPSDGLRSIAMLVDVHRESAPPAFATYQGWRRQKPWGFCLCEFSELHIALEVSFPLPPVCFFLTFAGR